MRYYTLIFYCFAISVQARKTVITLFNDSPEGILVSIDTKPHPPLQKNEINVHEAKNFFLPPLLQDNPYYFIVNSSSEAESKTFLIWTDPRQKKIFMSRGDVSDLAKSLQMGDFTDRPSLRTHDPLERKSHIKRNSSHHQRERRAHREVSGASILTAEGEDDRSYIVSEMGDHVLSLPDRVIKISYRGSLRPEIPEVSFVK